jgi:hypothetical protein
MTRLFVSKQIRKVITRTGLLVIAAVFGVLAVLAAGFVSGQTAQAGHDNGDNQCISDVKVISLGGANTFAVNGQSPTVGFEDHHNHDTKEDEVVLQVDTTPTATVKVPESDIGDGGSDKGNWNSISNSTLEVRIRDASRDGSDITSIYVDVHDTDCGDDNTSGNNPPTADYDGTLSLSICTSDNLDIDVLSNDEDPDVDPLQVVGLRASTSDSFASTTVTKNNGFASIIGNGTEDQDYHVRYSPDSAYTGPDSFQYKVSDNNGGSDTAMVYLDVQGEDGGCGDIRVSFDYTNGAGSSGGTADPTYDHASTSNLSPKTTATSGDQLVWNVPLEVATSTAELIDDYIEPPEGYQIQSSQTGPISKQTETGENFTNENTSAWLGEDYKPDSFNACTDGEDNDDDGDTDDADCNCTDGDTGSEASGGSCQAQCPNMSGDQVAASEYECFADNDSDCPSTVPDSETAVSTYNFENALQSDDVVTVPNRVTAKIEDSAGNSPPQYEIYAETTVKALDGAGNTVGQESQRVEADVPADTVSSDYSRDWSAIELSNIGGAESLEITSEADVVYTDTGTEAYALGKAKTGCPTIESNQDPQADIITQSQGQQNQCLRLDGSGSSDADGSIADYHWRLESNNFQKTQNGSGVLSDHSFGEQNTWNITLTVTDDDGATDSAFSSHDVEPIPDGGAKSCDSYSWDPNWGQ